MLPDLLFEHNDSGTGPQRPAARTCEHAASTQVFGKSSCRVNSTLSHFAAELTTGLCSLPPGPRAAGADGHHEAGRPRLAVR